MPCLPMCALGSTTHTGRDGIECCDLCGYPVHSAPDERDRLKAELRAAEAAWAALKAERDDLRLELDNLQVAWEIVVGVVTTLAGLTPEEPTPPT